MDIRQNEHGQIIHLEVKDDGCGIPEQSLPHIFDTFYQVNTEENPRMSGVGIGLAMVKLLVQKHNGSVYVDQTYKDGCCICVDIPYISVPIPAETEQGDIETHGVNMLIVEDTKDMLEFISSVFDGNSLVFKAGNGKDALEILKNHDIDIIISDISMPVMNGFEMLKQIRNNDLFRHIPVIMLTVENSLETKIKGLEYGADAYIEKPFSTKHLKVTVDNLLNRRENLRKRFTYSPLKQENDSITSDKDKEWFARVTELINSNISEPEISIDTLAGDLNMSRSSFQRKIKGLTGLSPVEFIRLIRLKKAAELLSAGTYRINEVSYMVGFNKPSYFSALFKKQFGVLPKEFISKEES
jgi:YesN/AraC family two-component response regulator